MQHCEPGELARAAASEAIAPADTAHLEECMWCSAEVGSMRDIIAAMREPSKYEASAPDPDVWQGISALTQVHHDPGPLLVRAPVAPGPLPEMAMPGTRRPDPIAPVDRSGPREGDDSDIWSIDAAMAEYGDEPISWENPSDRQHTPVSVTTPGAGSGVPARTRSDFNAAQRASRSWSGVAAAAVVALLIGGAGGVAVGRATADQGTSAVCPSTP